MSRKSRTRNLKKMVAQVIKDMNFDQRKIDEAKEEALRLKMEDEQSSKTFSNVGLIELPVAYLNDWNRCYLCKKPRTELQLIKHHITYFPQKCCFVHYECHQKIHDPDNPVTELIGYSDGDARTFYEMIEEKNEQ